MLQEIFSILAVLFASLLWFCNHAVGSHPFPKWLQGFKSLPLIGNALDIALCMPHIHDAVAKRTIQRGGRTWAFSVPFKPTYWVVTSPTNVEYVLKSNASNYVKGKTFKDNLGEILGRGIFAVDGQEWYWQRKLATHIFSARR